MIDGKNLIKDQPIKVYMKTCYNIRKTTTDQLDDYTTGCWLDYNYFKKHFSLIVIDLITQKALDSNPKAIQQKNFTANLGGVNNRVIFSFLKKKKKNILDFPKELREHCNKMIKMSV